MLELATLSDREAVEEMARQVHEMHVRWSPDTYREAEEVYPVSRFEREIGGKNLYTAKIGGIPVGYVLVRIREVSHPHLQHKKQMSIEEFCVREGCRRQGIGKAMLGDLHALARAFRCTGLRLNVDPHNEEAIALYQKCGMMIENIVMEKSL